MTSLREKREGRPEVEHRLKMNSVDPLPFPPKSRRRLFDRIAARMALADRAARDGDPLAYSRPDPLLAAYWAEADRRFPRT